jgi:hypothetical protein
MSPHRQKYKLVSRGRNCLFLKHIHFSLEEFDSLENAVGIGLDLSDHISPWYHTINDDFFTVDIVDNILSKTPPYPDKDIKELPQLFYLLRDEETFEEGVDKIELLLVKINKQIAKREKFWKKHSSEINNIEENEDFDS